MPRSPKDRSGTRDKQSISYHRLRKRYSFNRVFIYRFASMWKQLYLFLVLVCSTHGASLPPCPEKCICDTVDGKLHATCSTLELLRKLQPKQIRALESLVVRDARLTAIDIKLKVLRDLKTLDLSNNEISSLKEFPDLPNLIHLNLSSNRIKFFSASALPKTLTGLDLSSNLISDIHKDVFALKNLRNLNITNNPIFCTCSALWVRDSLKDAQVVLNEPVTCEHPSEFRGKSWYASGICPQKQRSVNIWDEYQADEPQIEGSGSGDVIEDLAAKGSVPFEQDIEKEFIPELNRAKTHEEDETFEGSGYVINEDYSKIRPKACHMNCSTPPPIEDKNVTDASPISGLDAIRIIAEDFSGKNIEEPQSTTQAVIIISEKPVVEKEFVLSTQKVVESPHKETSPKANIEVFKVASETEKQKTEVQTNQSNGVYILLFVLGALLILLILYAVTSTIKKKNKRQRNLQNDSDKKSMQGMTEMTPIKKSLPEKDGNLAERVPLMNGQNGKTAEEPKNEENTNLLTPANGDNEFVELRKKLNKDALLTPETKRVTIRAGEIPGSVPRTPLLVERHISSDGKVITTPSSDQHI